MQETILNESLQLLVYGMGTVFLFLFLLVLATNFMSSLVTKFAPEPELPASPKSSSKPANVNPELLQAIGLAVQEYRKAQRK